MNRFTNLSKFLDKHSNNQRCEYIIYLVTISQYNMYLLVGIIYQGDATRAPMSQMRLINFN